jgi:hypothetical protein
VHLKGINDIIKEVGRIKDRAELDVTAVLENLCQVEPTPNITMYWIIGISICIILLIIVCCYYKKSIRNWSRAMLWRAIRQLPIPQPRQRNKKGTGHSSEYASTVDIVLPLNVIATNPSGGEQEEAEIELNEISRAPTPS